MPHAPPGSTHKLIDFDFWPFFECLNNCKILANYFVYLTIGAIWEIYYYNRTWFFPILYLENSRCYGGFSARARKIPYAGRLFRPYLGQILTDFQKSKFILFFIKMGMFFVWKTFLQRQYLLFYNCLNN